MTPNARDMPNDDDDDDDDNDDDDNDDDNESPARERRADRVDANVEENHTHNDAEPLSSPSSDMAWSPVPLEYKLVRRMYESGELHGLEEEEARSKVRTAAVVRGLDAEKALRELEANVVFLDCVVSPCSTQSRQSIQS